VCGEQIKLLIASTPIDHQITSWGFTGYVRSFLMGGQTEKCYYEYSFAGLSLGS
jgi:hypothetical protein